MKARIRNWGNSLGLRIPKAFAEEAKLESGSEVDLELRNGEIIIRPVTPAYVLEELLAGVTPGNLHGEIDSGDSAGREVC